MIVSPASERPYVCVSVCVSQLINLVHRRGYGSLPMECRKCHSYAYHGLTDPVNMPRHLCSSIALVPTD